MHWEGATIQMLRVWIDDNPHSGEYTYTDARLKEILLVAGMYVTQEITLKQVYDVDIIYGTISPDPYDSKDTLFMNMMVLKAACIMDHAYLRERTLLSGLSAKCGPASLSTTQSSGGLSDIVKLGACDLYQKLKEEAAFSGEALNQLVHFVLSPFVGNDFDPVSALNTYYDSQRMIR